MEKIEYLIEQFKTAVGTNYTDFSSLEFMSEFFEWIKSRQDIGKEYVSFIEYMELPFKDTNSAEIGKTQYDTIVSSFETKIITPVTIGLEEILKIEKERIITSDFKVVDNKPILIKPNNKSIEISNDNIKTFITQNPYTPEYISNWEQLHNSGKYSIILGAYGKIYDKDIDKKLNELEALRDKLDEPYKEEFAVMDDNYYYAITSHKPKTLKLSLTRY